MQRYLHMALLKCIRFQPATVESRMDPGHLTQLVQLEDNYWWHVAKRKLVLQLLRRFASGPGRLVEGGIGSGRNLVEFRKQGYEVTGFDLMPESVEHVQRRGIEDVRVHDLQDFWPVEARSLRAVVLLDVLEHIEHPVKVLQHVHKALADDGSVIVTVPACPWLNHWNCFTLPAAMAVRSWEKISPRRNEADFPAVSSLTNRLLLTAAAAERCCMEVSGIPAGLSLAGVLRK